jgi:RNA polymerase sigma factor (TIGR02999 family)
MDKETEGSVTKLLNAATQGDEEAESRVWSAIYSEVHQMAHRILSKEQNHPTLQTTMVVNEVYLQLAISQPAQWENRRHFFGSVARTIGQFLIQQHRRRNRLKRGGGWNQVPIKIAAGELSVFDKAMSDQGCRAVEALKELDTISPRPAEVAWLRFVAGLSVEHTARALDVSPRTVKKDWSFAKAWLRSTLHRHSEDLTGDPP